jgi:5-formyltetrahydrofolate cyclo-ligase
MRADLRERRMALNQRQRLDAAFDAARIFLRTRPLIRARRIAVYLATGSELDTAPLIDALQRSDRKLYAPRLGRTFHGSQSMRLVQLRPGTPLRRNRHGISEPCGKPPEINPTQLDVILLPLLGYDGEGHRLGMGGGYYDRLLEHPRCFRRPLRIGYAYALQQVPRIPHEPWDQKLDGVITERGMTWF